MNSKYIPSTQCMVAVVTENMSQDKFMPELLGWEAGQLMQEGGPSPAASASKGLLFVPPAVFSYWNKRSLMSSLRLK